MKLPPARGRRRIWILQQLHVQIWRQCTNTNTITLVRFTSAFFVTHNGGVDSPLNCIRNDISPYQPYTIKKYVECVLIAMVVCWRGVQSYVPVLEEGVCFRTVQSWTRPTPLYSCHYLEYFCTLPNSHLIYVKLKLRLLTGPSCRKRDPCLFRAPWRANGSKQATVKQ